MRFVSQQLKEIESCQLGLNLFKSRNNAGRGSNYLSWQCREEEFLSAMPENGRRVLMDHRLNPILCIVVILRVNIITDEMPSEFFAGYDCGTRTDERIQHNITRTRKEAQKLLNNFYGINCWMPDSFKQSDPGVVESTPNYPRIESDHVVGRQ